MISSRKLTFQTENWIAGPVYDTIFLFNVFSMYFFFTEREKDTKAEDVTKITFVPTLQTFEMNIMEELGIKEDRIPEKVYWY